jgi:hypothetical protein
MRLPWVRAVRQSIVSLMAAGETPTRHMASIGVGFCPGCKRLRATTSPRCTSCGSAAPVAEDA